MEYVKKVVCSTLSVIAVATSFSAIPDRAAAGPEPFLGDIVAVGYNFCPRGWAMANGQLLAISSNTALFSLFGTTFGGDGRTTFGLPDLQGRVAMGQGTGPGLTTRVQGQKFGQEQSSLTTGQMPTHSHAANANNLDGDKPGPGGKLLAAAPPSGTGSETIYSDQPPSRTMSAAMISNTGQSLPLNLQDPFLATTFCVAMQGVYPSRP